MKILNNIGKDSFYTIIILMSFIFLGEAKLLYAQGTPVFKVEKPTKEIILNQPFTLDFTLNFSESSTAYTLTDFELKPNENIEIVSSTNQTKVLVSSADTKIQTIFTYTIIPKEKHIVISSAKITLTDSDGKTQDIYSEEIYLDAKTKKEYLTKINTAISKHKSIFALSVIAAITVLILVITTIISIRNNKNKNNEE